MEIANVFTVECSAEVKHVEYPDSGKVATVDAKGEDIFQTRYGEPVGYWDGES